MSTMWNNINVSHSEIVESFTSQARWTRLYICLFWAGHLWYPLCKRNSPFAIIILLISFFIKVVKIKLLLSLLQAVSRT